MDAQGLFGDKNLQLIEVSQKILLELCKEPCAALTAEIKYRHDDHLIEIKPRLALPNTPEREFALLRRQAAEPSHQPSFYGIEYRVGNWTAGIIC
jgi:hypothetical protein